MNKNQYPSSLEDLINKAQDILIAEQFLLTNTSLESIDEKHFSALITLFDLLDDHLQKIFEIAKA